MVMCWHVLTYMCPSLGLKDTLKFGELGIMETTCRLKQGVRGGGFFGRLVMSLSFATRFQNVEEIQKPLQASFGKQEMFCHRPTMHVKLCF
ncbi:hypothetical protein Hanom_Chr03g00228211 [Helianthus anomalus]